IAQKLRYSINYSCEIFSHLFIVNKKHILPALSPLPPPGNMLGPRQPVHAVAAIPFDHFVGVRHERAEQCAIVINNAGKTAYRMPGDVYVLGVFTVGTESS